MISMMILCLKCDNTHLEVPTALEGVSLITAVKRKGWEPDSIEGIKEVSYRSWEEKLSSTDSRKIIWGSVQLHMGGFGNSTQILVLSSVQIWILGLLLLTLVGLIMLAVMFWLTDEPISDCRIFFEELCLMVDLAFDGKSMKNFPIKRTSCCREDCWRSDMTCRTTSCGSEYFWL